MERYGLDASLTLVGATAMAAVLCVALRPVARLIGLIDRPSANKPHVGEVPLVGGIAVLLAATAVVPLAVPPAAVSTWLLGGGLAMLLTGALDDAIELGPRLRLLLQVAACTLAAVYGEMLILDFGQLLSERTLVLGALAVPITVFSVVGLINAFNMVDGMDGLAGSVFVVAAGAMAVCGVAAGQVAGTIAAVLACSVLGFLLLNARFPWNRRARVFMGDSGSMLLGFLLGWFTVVLSQGEDRAFAPVTAIWLCAVPLLDTGSLIIRRIGSGHGPLNRDLHHLHHLFLRAGFSVTQTWLIIVALTALLAAIGLVGEFSGVPEHWRFYGFLLVTVLYHLSVVRLWRRGRVFGRQILDMEAVRAMRARQSVS